MYIKNTIIKQKDPNKKNIFVNQNWIRKLTKGSRKDEKGSSFY